MSFETLYFQELRIVEKDKPRKYEAIKVDTTQFKDKEKAYRHATEQLMQETDLECPIRVSKDMVKGE
jgi:hypothetical protein